MALVDDLKLVRLTDEQDRDLFPVLQRAPSMTPLVVLLAFLPALYALYYRTLEDYDALWGMKSLSIATASDIESVVDPTLIDSPSPPPLKWSPPLGSWLTALFILTIGSWPSLTIVLVSFLSVAGSVGMWFLLWRRLAGARMGLLAALLLAFHAPFLVLVQDPAPHALGILFALVSFWAFLSHQQEVLGIFSSRVLVGGIGLGVCLLASGPLALIVLIILLFYVLGLRGESLDQKRRPAAERKRIWVGRPALKTLMVMALISFAIGGWWALMMGARYGSEFWMTWLTGSVSEQYDGLPPAEPLALSELSGLIFEKVPVALGWLSGLSLFGLRRVVGEILRPTKEKELRWIRFSLIWIFCGGSVWLISLASLPSSLFLQNLYHPFMLLPWVALAAFTIDQIVQRRVSVAELLGILLITLLILLWPLLVDYFGDEGWDVLLGIDLLIAIGFLIGAVWLWKFSQQDEYRKRWLLRGLVLVLLLGHTIAGKHSVQNSTEDDHQLALFRGQLTAVEEVYSCTLVTESPPPLRLVYLLSSVWPEARLNVIHDPNAVLSQATNIQAEVEAGTDIVVGWGVEQVRPSTPKAGQLRLTPLGSPRYFQERELVAFSLPRQNGKAESISAP